MASKDKYV